jgi:hypothetical protein
MGFCWSDLLTAADFHRAILTRLQSEHPTIVFLFSFQYGFEEMRFRVNDGKSQPWYRLYASAVLELESKQVNKRVAAAEAAIHGRLRDLQYDSDHHEERHLMEEAQRTLEFLRRSTF